MLTQPLMAGWFGRQAKRIRLMGAYVASGRTDEIVYSLKNRLRGIDLEHVSVGDLGLPADRAHFHSSSGGPDCARVLRALRIPPGSVALDLGSGKGGAVLTMARFPFSEVIGVELSKALVAIARANVERARVRNVRFVQADASEFTDLDRVTHLYMYNPFPCVVMRAVMANVRASLSRRDRELTMVYKNPECHDAIVEPPRVFEKVQETKAGVHWWFVYRHTARPGGAAAEPLPSD
jgi:protein-L-isoaspartate O-methyltransferase